MAGACFCSSLLNDIIQESCYCSKIGSSNIFWCEAFFRISAKQENLKKRDWSRESDSWRKNDILDIFVMSHIRLDIMLVYRRLMIWWGTTLRRVENKKGLAEQNLVVYWQQLDYSLLTQFLQAILGYLLAQLLRNI